MKNVLLMGVILNTLDKTHQNQQRCSNLFSPTEVASSDVKQSLQLKCPIREVLYIKVCVTTMLQPALISNRHLTDNNMHDYI